LGPQGKMSRVLVVSNMYPSARFPKFGSFVSDIVGGLRREGCEILLATSGDPRTGAARNALKYAGLALKCVAAAIRGGFDVVHAHYLFPSGTLAAIPARLRGKPLVLFAHGSDILLADWRWPVGALTRRATLRADRVVAPSRAFADELVTRLGVSPERIAVIPSGIDLELFAPGDRAQARVAQNLPVDVPVLAFVGALNDNKGEGCADIVRALAEPGLEKVILCVVGEGPRLGALKSLAAEVEVTTRVQFRLFVEREELVVLYRAADIVVIPSRRESLGIVSLEAQAVGTPVVATRVGGLVEHLTPGVSGEFYEPGDVAGLAEALRTVLAQPTRYSPAENRENYGIVHAARSIIELNESLVSRGGART
jgi:D-inositol-3-phosphate glycosyltransferase